MVYLKNFPLLCVFIVTKHEPKQLLQRGDAPEVMRIMFPYI